MSGKVDPKKNVEELVQVGGAGSSNAGKTPCRKSSVCKIMFYRSAQTHVTAEVKDSGIYSQQDEKRQ